MATPISNEERLFSLVLALLATETGLTKADVLSSVQGYRQRYRAGGNNASLERQFERDKDDVRELGVPLEAIEPPADAGAAQFTRYRIPKGAYDLPADVTFSPEEIALLNLAGVVWREGSLSGDSRRALIKLRSLGVAADDPLLGYAPRLRVRDPAFDPLSTAIERHQVVRFGYLKPGETAARRRTIAPDALVQFGGHWLVHGVDRTSGRAAGPERTFLLERIVGAVESTGERFDPPAGDPAADALAGLEALTAGNRAVVEVAPGTDAEARVGRRGERTDDGAVVLHYPDLALLADELAAFGPEVLVREPTALAEAVVARLRRVEADHTGETDG